MSFSHERAVHLNRGLIDHHAAWRIRFPEERHASNQYRGFGLYAAHDLPAGFEITCKRPALVNTSNELRLHGERDPLNPRQKVFPQWPPYFKISDQESPQDPWYFDCVRLYTMCPTSLINHSDVPNCQIGLRNRPVDGKRNGRFEMCFITLRPVEAQEELLFYFGQQRSHVESILAAQHDQEYRAAQERIMRMVRRSL